LNIMREWPKANSDSELARAVIEYCETQATPQPEPFWLGWSSSASDAIVAERERAKMQNDIELEAWRALGGDGDAAAYWHILQVTAMWALGAVVLWAFGRACERVAGLLA
jgi:hypothetical protein